jgi:hypothetical protein
VNAHRVTVRHATVQRGWIAKGDGMRTRDWRRRGVRPILVEVSHEAIEFLEVSGYLADRSDAAIAAAVSRILADSATS